MTLETLTLIINELKKQSEVTNQLYKLNVDLIDYTDPYEKIISLLLKEVYGTEGYDWFSWFCYERDYGKNQDLSAWDENSNPICYDIESLWKYLESNHNKSNSTTENLQPIY